MYNNQQQQEEDTLESEDMRKIFAGSLARTTSDESFNDYFSQFGEILSSGIIRDPNTKESRGCGFVTYASSDIVEQILKARPHAVDNKTLDVKRAIPKEFEGDAARTKTTRLFVGGFKGFDLTPEELREYLDSRHPADYGTIEQIDFLKDRNTNELKGFGFIECSSFDFADRLAIAEHTFSLRGRRMSIKKAEERDNNQQKFSGNQGGGPMRGGGMRGGRGRGRGRGGRGGYGGNNYGNYDGYNQENSYYGQQDSYNSYDNNGYETAYPQTRSYGGQQGGNWNSASARYQPY